MRIRSRIVLVEVLAIAVAVLAACTPSGPAAGGSGDGDGDKSITIGVTALGAQYDPGAGAYMYSSLDVNAVYDSLLIQNDKGSWDPWLATKYELSDDRKGLSFTLRDDVDFVDGVHLNADAVVGYLEAERANKAFSMYAKWLQFGVKFKTTGEYTFTATGKTPFDYDLIYGVVATTPIASPKAIKDPKSLTKTPVGTGPYKIDQVVPDVSATFVRNPDYWNKAAFPFDTVKLQVFDDDVAALNALKSKQIDAAGLSIANAVEAKGSGFTVASTPGRFVSLYFADRAGKIQPAFADKRVRQAINYAFDRKTINDTLNLGFGRVSSQPFSSIFPEYVEGKDDYYTYDLDKAKALMADAGYANGFDLKLPSTTFLGINETAPVVQQTLSELNIRVTFDQINDPTAFFKRARDGKYPVLLYNEAYVNALTFIDAKGFWNYLGYNDPKAQALYDTVRTGSIEESTVASKKLGEYILEQAWLAPFSAPESPWASVSGVRVDLAAGNSGVPYLVNFHTNP